MKQTTRFRAFALLTAVLAIGILTSPGALAAGRGRVDGYRPAKDVLRVAKADGSVKRVETSARPKVVLKDADGDTELADENELSDGAKIVALRDPDDDGEVEKIIVKELASGSSDCSFDSSEDIDEDGSSSDESFDCSLDYDGDNESESKSCSFDKSGDQELGDRSKSLSWDCSYDYSDDENDSSWDCSFDASEDRSADESGGTADGDFSFDCSWDSSLPYGAPLFDCNLDSTSLAFTCASNALQMDFGYALDLSDVQFDAELDFNRDYVEEGDDEDGTLNCTETASGAECSFDGSADSGNCSIDFSFTKDGDANGGSVSGDASYSCSWEATA